MQVRSGFRGAASRHVAGFVRCALFFVGCAVVAQAQNVTTVTNVFQDHYAYGYTFGSNACPNGYSIDSSQYASTPTYGSLHLERGHAMHHVDPVNAANDYWVYWAHLDSSNYGLAEAAVFKSTTECGPYILQSQTGNQYSVDGSGYGFRPGGWQYRDDNIFRDVATQTYNSDGSVASYANAYAIAASNDLGTQTSPSGGTCNYANDSMAIFKMTQDYLGIDASTNPATNGANWAFVCGQREAPVMFRQGSKYFLITSQAAGWYPSQGGYGVSSGPLTGWSPSALTLGNTSTFGGQTADGFSIIGTQATSYFLSFDHLGGSDSKNPASKELYDTGGFVLPVILDGNAGTATLSWTPSFSVDNTTGVLTLPTMTNLALGGTATSTVTSAASSGTTTYVPGNAIDGNYSTRWTGSASGASSFSAAKPTNTSVLCPVTNATTNTTCNPSLIVDIGSVQPVQQIDLSWYMVKGSEPYYTYKIAYSSDGSTWKTQDYTTFAPGALSSSMNISSVPFSNNVMYGFNSLPVNFSARYVALLETSVVQQNTSTPFYGPNLFEMAVYQSTAPAVPQSVNVAVTPSSTTPDPSVSNSVGVVVSGPMGQPTPTGYVQLSAPGYTSETYGLVNGASNFTIPAGVLTGGSGTINVAFRADASSAPVYGIGTTTGQAAVNVSSPDAPLNLAVTQSSPNALTASWSVSSGATGYVLYRSVAGGSYSQLATTTATSYVDSSLSSNGVTYCYVVAATNAAGAGSMSSPACNTATTNFPVNGVSVTQTGPGALTISYNTVANVTGYTIKRSVAGGAYSVLATPTATSYTDSGLATDGTTYCYTVAAVFSTGTGSDSAPVCGTASTNFSPAGVQVTPWASGQLYVTWTASSSGTSYSIQRSLNGGAYTTVGTATIPTYIDTGLTSGTNVYCYVVNAILNGVSSNNSSAVCAIPVSTFLAVPNYSFETPSVSLWSTQPSALNGSGSWTFVGNASNTGNNSGVSASSGTWTQASTPVIPLGSQVGILEGTGSVTQTLSGFVPGNIYTVTVLASQRQTSYQGGPNSFSINVNGSSIGSFSPLQSIAYYRDYRATFTAAQSSNVLALAGTSTGQTNAVLIDNIRVTSTGATATQISVAPMTISQGTGYAVLTATQTFNGSAPAGPLVFQVGSGDQVGSTCTVSGSSRSCSVTYPTAAVAAGTAVITATYLGDASYAATAGSGTLTVNDTGTGVVQLTSTAPVSRNADGSLQVIVTVRNAGSTTASAVSVSSLTLGAASASAVPSSLGNIAPGGTATVTLTVPASAGSSGSTVMERLSGTYTGGTFGSGSRVRLP